MNIQSAVVRNLSKWRSRAEPASDLALLQLANWRTEPFPAEFLELLKVSNGGEVPLAISPWWFHLWSSVEIPAHNAGYETEKWFPGYVGFGSNGGGEMFAFHKNEGSKVFAIPFCNCNPNDISLVANTFSDFAAALGIDVEPTP